MVTFTILFDNLREKKSVPLTKQSSTARFRNSRGLNTAGPRTRGGPCVAPCSILNYQRGRGVLQVTSLPVSVESFDRRKNVRSDGLTNIQK